MKQWENPLCVCLEKLEELEREVHFTKACEPAGFVRSLYWNDLQKTFTM